MHLTIFFETSKIFQTSKAPVLWVYWALWAGPIWSVPGPFPACYDSIRIKVLVFLVDHSCVSCIMANHRANEASCGFREVMRFQLKELQDANVAIQVGYVIFSYTFLFVFNLQKQVEIFSNYLAFLKTKKDSLPIVLRADSFENFYLLAS